MKCHKYLHQSLPTQLCNLRASRLHHMFLEVMSSFPGWPAAAPAAAVPLQCPQPRHPPRSPPRQWWSEQRCRRQTCSRRGELNARARPKAARHSLASMKYKRAFIPTAHASLLKAWCICIHGTYLCCSFHYPVHLIRHFYFKNVGFNNKTYASIF